MKLKIMTFNIQHCLDYKRRVIDHTVMTDVIAGLDADVCGLNEVRGRGKSEDYTAQAERMAATLDMHGVFGQSALIHGYDPYGNAVLSKFPIMSFNVIPIPQITDTEPRSVLRCELSSGLQVYQSHFGLSTPEFECAVETAHTLLKNETKPAVLMGDFNMTPDNEILKPLTDSFESADKYLDSALTFPSDAPRIKIDYIFANDKVKILSARVPEIVASDHRPIVAEIEY